MATKKQRKRREKERRHEYEYVYVDDEGNEVAVDEEADGSKPAKNGKAPSQKVVRTAAGRKIEPPSWRRSLRRAAIFAPLILVVLYLIRTKEQTLSSILLSVLLLMAFFVPFSYFMDSLMYRFALKRGAKGPGAKR